MAELGWNSVAKRKVNGDQTPAHCLTHAQALLAQGRLISLGPRVDGMVLGGHSTSARASSSSSSPPTALRWVVGSARWAVGSGQWAALRNSQCGPTTHTHTHARTRAQWYMATATATATCACACVQPACLPACLPPYSPARAAAARSPQPPRPWPGSRSRSGRPLYVDRHPGQRQTAKGQRRERAARPPENYPAPKAPSAARPLWGMRRRLKPVSRKTN